MVESFEDFRKSCVQNILEHEVKVIFIDSLHGLNTDEKSKKDKLGFDSMFKELKQMSRKYNVSLVVTCQLNRNVENRPGNCKRPMLSDLRGSGIIEQEADKVLFLYRHEYYGLTWDEEGRDTAGIAEIIMAKNSIGTTGITPIEASKNFSKFQNLSDYESLF